MYAAPWVPPVPWQLPPAAVAALSARADAPPTLGFHSHVDVGIRERALAAGCSRVVPRSALMQRFAALIAETPSAPA